MRFKPYVHTVEDEWGERMLFAFENAWGASVIMNRHSYGGEQGLWELAVMHGPGTDHTHVCYQSGVTDDVIGRLEWWQVEDVLETISRLPHADPSKCPDVDALDRALKSLGVYSEALKADLLGEP